MELDRIKLFNGDLVERLDAGSRGCGFAAFAELASFYCATFDADFAAD